MAASFSFEIGRAACRGRGEMRCVLFRTSPVAAQLVERRLGHRLRVAQGGRALVVLAVDGRVLLLRDALQLLLRRLELGRRGAGAKAHAAGRLVDEVDGLVGQVAVRDVADREVRRRLHRLVADADLVVFLVARANTEEDVDRLLERGLLDHHRLETTLERGIALDVLAVLVERGGPDALELAAGERRLQDVGGVDRALRSAGAHERVQLVDEEDRVVRAAKLLDDLLEALLELAAVLRAGHEGSDVERQHALVEEGFGHVAGDDPLCQPLGDGRLADAGFTDEGRVVLGAPGEDLDDPLDLLLAPDDGVDLAGPDRVCEVDAELVHRGRLAGPLRLGRGTDAARLGQDADDLVADLVEVHAERFQDAGGDAFALAHESQQQVLRTDVVVTQTPGLVDGQLDDPLRDALALAHEPEQQVFRPDVVVVEPLRFVLGQGQDLARAIRELVETVHPVERLFCLETGVRRLRAILACATGRSAARRGGTPRPIQRGRDATKPAGGPTGLGRVRSESEGQASTAGSCSATTGASATSAGVGASATASTATSATSGASASAVGVPATASTAGSGSATTDVSATGSASVTSGVSATASTATSATRGPAPPPP